MPEANRTGQTADQEGRRRGAMSLLLRAVGNDRVHVRIDLDRFQ